MYKKVVVDGKEMEFAATAATPFRYKQVFHKDLLQVFSSEEKAQEEGVEAVTQLAYIMSKTAEKADMNKLNYDTFIEWLEDFSPMAFVDSADDILNVYMESSKSTSTP